MLPEWASIPSDAKIYPRPTPITPALSNIILDETARCSCGALYDSAKPTIHRPCTIYVLAGALESTIELQICQNCSTGQYRHIGPDARQLGLFNYNNRLLFSHDLLDEYTMAYTSSETPFVAWVSVVLRRYQKISKHSAFVDEGTFRSAWFGYARLLHLENDMSCPQCGILPDEVIWDGITLAFNRKHLMGSLYPPTTAHERADIRHSRYPKKQTLIINKECRKLLKTVCTGRSLIIGRNFGQRNQLASQSLEDETDSEDDGLEGQSQKGKEKVLEDVLSRINQIPQLLELLAQESPALAQLFNIYSGIPAIAAKIECPPAYARFFKQVSKYAKHGAALINLWQIASHESVLQMAHRPALKALNIFVQLPTVASMEELACIPLLYHLLQMEFAKTKTFTDLLLDVCKWILKRGNVVLDGLIIHGIPAEDPSAQQADGGWQKVCNGNK